MSRTGFAASTAHFDLWVSSDCPAGDPMGASRDEAYAPKQRCHDSNPLIATAWRALKRSHGDKAA